MIPAAIDCETAVRRLWDFLDGELRGARLAEMEAHLAGCAECTEHVRFSRLFLRTVTASAAEAAEASGAAPGTDPDAALRARIVARLAAEGFRRA